MKLSELAIEITNIGIEKEQTCQCPDHASGNTPRLTDEQMAALRLVFSQKQTFNLVMAIVARIVAIDAGSSLTFMQDVLECKQQALESMAEIMGTMQDGIPKPEGNA